MNGFREQKLVELRQALKVAGGDILSPLSSPSLPLPLSSFPRKRESSAIREKTAGILDSRFRGNDRRGNGKGGSESNWPDGFPADLLGSARLNEIGAVRYGDVAAYGFVLMALQQLARRGDAPFLWCRSRRQAQEDGQLFGPGLKAFGLDPGRIIQVEAGREIDCLWTMEEAARSGELGAVVGFVENLSFTQSRRLSLASARGGVPVFMVRPFNYAGAGAAFSRWKVASCPSEKNELNARAPGRVGFEVELFQCRDGRKGKWKCHYEQQNERQTDFMPVVASSGHGKSPARAGPMQAA